MRILGKSKPLWYSPCRLCRGRLWQRRCPNHRTSPHTSPPTHDTYRHRTWWSECQTPAGINVTCLSGTCPSWRSAPAWLNPCWPSSFQRWTSSWNTHTSCFKHSWFQNVYIFVLENTLLKYVMGKKALKKKCQVPRSVWSMNTHTALRSHDITSVQCHTTGGSAFTHRPQCSSRFSHVRFVVAADLLDADVVLGVHEGFGRGVGFSDRHHTGDVLEVIRRLHLYLPKHKI